MKNKLISNEKNIQLIDLHNFDAKKYYDEFLIKINKLMIDHDYNV